ncbi:MAG: TspO/MBR family protein [Terracidiphilus sp.]
MRWIGLVFWLGLCFTVAGVSGSWTAAEVPGWYATLRRPSIAPPSWVFAPAWTLLYALMAIAVWLVSLEAPSPLRTWGLALFLVQLALNFAWTLIFFRWHLIGGALAELLLLWLSIGATTLLFARIAPVAAFLIAPYWAWVTFAALLNWAYWRLN